MPHWRNWGLSIAASGVWSIPTLSSPATSCIPVVYIDRAPLPLYCYRPYDHVDSTGRYTSTIVGQNYGVLGVTRISNGGVHADPPTPSFLPPRSILAPAHAPPALKAPKLCFSASGSPNRICARMRTQGVCQFAVSTPPALRRQVEQCSVESTIHLQREATWEMVNLAPLL